MCMFEAPDLGCNEFETEPDCYTLTSPYSAPWEAPGPACFWDPDITCDPPMHDGAGCCALIEPDPENWTVERVMAILICMFVIEPFVIAMEWVMLNIINAPVARRRDPRALVFARAQQRFVWESLAREREVDGDADRETGEADAGTPRLGFAALVPPAVAAKRARHGGDRAVPRAAWLARAHAIARAHGHVKVAASTRRPALSRARAGRRRHARRPRDDAARQPGAVAAHARARRRARAARLRGVLRRRRRRDDGGAGEEGRRRDRARPRGRARAPFLAAAARRVRR